jgi:polygalacturonase
VNGGGFRSARDFGASGDGRTLDGPAIQAAIDAVSSGGGGEVVLPPGGYVSGSLFLRDGVALRLEEGAVLMGSRDVRDYPIVEGRWEGVTGRLHAGLLHARGAKDIAVVGRGLIDGRGQEWWRLFRSGELDFPRPRLVSIEDCERVSLRDFRAMDSPSWTINPVRSRDVSIVGLSIVNPPDSPNTDGIDPDSCSGIRIADCYISVGDDCIAIKSGSEGESAGMRASCEDVVVSGCVLERGHGAVVLGSEMSGGIRNVVVEDCVFRGTDRGIRMKSRRGRGGTVEGFRAKGIEMSDVPCPFTINLRYHCGGARGVSEVADLGARPFGAGTPVFRGLSFESIRAVGATVAAAWLDGLAESPIEDVSFTDVSVELGGDAAPAPAEMSDWAPPLSRAGFCAFDVRGLRLERVRLRGQAGPAYVMESCEGLRHSGCDPEPESRLSAEGRSRLLAALA